MDATALKKKPSGWLRKVLLLSAYQIVVQERTAPAKVVSETVSLVKKVEGEAPAKFANACLRKIAEYAPRWKALRFPSQDKKAECQWASLPPWFWDRLVQEHGAEWAKAFAMACLERPRIWIRARRADWKPEWAEPGPIPRSWYVTEGGAIFSKEGFDSGEFFVQDISSQILVQEIAEEVRSTVGSSIRALDLCAAPGGKSAGMAMEGIHVTATDRDESRMKLLRQTLTRVAPEAQVIARDQVSSLDPLDLVWVDAPCTGSGIIRRHPDVRWLRNPKELDALTELQRALVLEAWKKVKPGGYLAYSVCSVFQEEGKDLLAQVLKGAKPQREWLLVPQDEPFGDGFWAALFRKI